LDRGRGEKKQTAANGEKGAVREGERKHLNKTLNKKQKQKKEKGLPKAYLERKHRRLGGLGGCWETLDQTKKGGATEGAIGRHTERKEIATGLKI